MGIEASAVARGLGIETTYKDMRAGSVLFLPQRIMVIAQGATASTYSTTKIQLTNAPAVGSRFGYGSPAHLIARMLWPQNGDGVRSLPVTFYPLVDDGTAVAATGGITPSGTQTKAASYRAIINNIRSEAFVVTAGMATTDKCRVIGEAINAVLEMPMIATYTYGTVTASAVTGAGDGTVTALTAPGDAVPGAHTLVCNTAVAHGGVFTLTDPNGPVVSAAVTMTPATGGATVITAGGLQFTITDGAADFEVGDSFTITVPATAVVLTSKWKGESANDLYAEVDGDDYGTTFTIVQPSGGLVNPSIAAALAQVGNVWESMALNAMNIEDETTLDAIQTFGELRWGTLVHKPLLAFTGNTHTSVAAATAVSDTRKDDIVNVQLVSPGSNDLPFVVAARQLARIALMANNNPPTDYGALRATGLTPGVDGDQWDYLMRDQAVKAGSSTVEVNDSVVSIGDVVTFHHPSGDPLPSHRYVVDIVKLQNCIYNIDLLFGAQEWAGAPLIPDAQPTVNPNAKKPKMAKAAVCEVIDSLGLNAIISDPKTAKQNTTAVINAQNPKRLDVVVPVQVSGNTNVKSVDINYSFFFGTPAVIG